MLCDPHYIVSDDTLPAANQFSSRICSPVCSGSDTVSYMEPAASTLPDLATSHLDSHSTVLCSHERVDDLSAPAVHDNDANKCSNIILPGYKDGAFSRGNSYEAVMFCPDLDTLGVSLRYAGERHTIGGLPTQMNLAGWEHELCYESDSALRDYLYFGIHDGFIIVDPAADIPTYDCPNYISHDSGESYTYVNGLISQELLDHKYIKTSLKPHCIHAIGTVPKADGKFRPITDCKRPVGYSINNYMSTTCETFSYKSIDDVCNIIYPGCYMATVDISSAYRSISINPSQWKYQGVRWILNGSEELLFDVRVCFGVRNAPYLFTQISNFITRCMARRGYCDMVNYLDDFLVLGDSFSSCQEAQMTLISILISLGFEIAWKKCSSPSTTTQYLGIDFDSLSMQISLPSVKMHKLHTELEFFKNRTRATKTQLQRLCGVLAHCSKVIRGGRTFSRRIIDLLSGLPDGNPRITLSSEFRLDLLWWIEFSKEFNGVACLISYNFGDGPSIHTDSSFSGYGLVSGSHWMAGYFGRSDLPAGHNLLDPLHSHWVNYDLDIMNINVLELFPVLLATRSFAHDWSNQHVVCYSDNTQVVSCVNRGTSSNVHCMSMLREIFWFSAMYNFHITCRHVRGVDNYLPDLLSRISRGSDLSVISDFPLCCSGSQRPGSGSVGCDWCGVGPEYKGHKELPVEKVHDVLCGQ